MALATSQAERQAKASCPTCVGPLQAPVTLDYGHNCCMPYLQQCWEGLLDVLPCPVCQYHCPSRDIGRNPLLSTLADQLRQIASTSTVSQRKKQDYDEEALCALHQQVLDLF